LRSTPRATPRSGFRKAPTGSVPLAVLTHHLNPDLAVPNIQHIDRPNVKKGKKGKKKQKEIFALLCPSCPFASPLRAAQKERAV
jgi:hypothetical protein